MSSVEPSQSRRITMARDVPEVWLGWRREKDLMCRYPRMGKKGKKCAGKVE